MTEACPEVLKLIELNTQLVERLDRIEKQLSLGVVKESYTTEEVAERVNRVEWTVRDWANKGRISAYKVHGRGRQGEWRVTHEEVLRIQREGPRPPNTFSNLGPVKAA